MNKTPAEPKTRPIPVRFGGNDVERLDNANKMMGIRNRSAIVRFAVHTVLPQIEAGMIKIPQSFEEG